MIRVVTRYVHAVRNILPIIILGLFSTQAAPAEVSLRTVDWQTNTDGHLVTVRLTETIGWGDLERVRAAMKLAKGKHKLVVALEMDSEGGDGDTGIILADYVAKNNIDVLLEGSCWSACSFAAMVALGRGNLFIRPGAELGVHTVYDTATGVPDKQWTKRAAAILSKLGAPHPPLKAMVDTPADDLTLFDYSDLERMGGIVLQGEWSWWMWE